MSPSQAPGRWLGHTACVTALAALSVLAATARAQPAAAPARGPTAVPSSAPSDRPAAGQAEPGPAPLLPTQPSAFREYRAFADAPPADWRGANDTVGRIGGWRAYAREAQAPGEQAPDPGGAAHHGGHR